MTRSVLDIALNSKDKQLLIENGYLTLEDVCSSNPDTLCSRLKIDSKHAQRLYDFVLQFHSCSSSSSSPSLSEDESSHKEPKKRKKKKYFFERYQVKDAAEILWEEVHQPCLPTFCDALDDIWKIKNFCSDPSKRGGIHLGCVTEICGIPGVGKSQLGMQLCVNASLSKDYGGLASQTIFIDTEGSFVVERVLEMVCGFCYSQDLDENATMGIVNNCLNSVHVYRALDKETLIKLVDELDDILTKNPKIKLIVIDSIAFHFRGHERKEMFDRSQQLQHIGLKLTTLCHMNRIAVIAINHMTTSIVDQNASIVPALGEGWLRISSHRLDLKKIDENRFHALLIKSNCLPQVSAEFCITAEGLRDHHYDQEGISIAEGRERLINKIKSILEVSSRVKAVS